ncbi:cilia- and flagella-associated protein 20 [Cyclospora cayetanensis]|uniref:Uncharacterized protein n=2 Tax=Cyclospora cayetanensis TaxID=88456 RepID=A0A1D3D8F8_9EIME|nr:cilia- and flagella-associated protein 20 [Cyclospora cayetanensis]OEH79740.1 hypothetical protein cyc_02371 [Cyclospora cayetanensis]
MLPAFQSGYISILYSVGSHPLQLWARREGGGSSITKKRDDALGTTAIELRGPVPACHICCPPDPEKALGVTLPVIVLLVKNLNKLFSFEVQTVDSKGVKRRFRASNFQKTARIKPYLCTMPLRMDCGWVYVHLNLADLTRKAFGTNYVQTSRVQVHANCRLKRIFFAEYPFREDQLPEELRLPIEDITS